ncbi:hypothetical protein LJ753_05575 [Arthrobacter sp. zg-Y20]|uniref:hypothetical protein n=1 Tax=unclassified Arthrobacter TaxID=235627 RepID=UPI001D14B29D|nr:MULTISPECIES: hypothetical protein [unclassified Arthrobacter]MCC3275337.1 hypothetical protein [Arthrobacter sp. zg-Y20]MDK1315495.1 hypothetical protein [Arthrobacter sp. zg.Y20]WIB05911.1 hypothetical protein QNO06_15550 [Arthrobacter sp. zg-Y20]
MKEFLGTAEDTLKVDAADRKIVARTIDPGGLVLNVDGQPRFRLSVTYHCELSESRKYLAVDRSTFNVFVVDQGMPLIRYDYLRRPRKTPGAHINFRMDTEAAATALKVAGNNRKTKQRRKRGHGDGHGTPSQLHLPVGGPRFRPCLEDVLEFLATELAVDSASTWQDALTEGRTLWRETQLKAATQDNPEAAAEALRELGYLVEWDSASGEVPQLRLHRLGQF